MSLKCTGSGAQKAIVDIFVTWLSGLSVDIFGRSASSPCPIPRYTFATESVTVGVSTVAVNSPRKEAVWRCETMRDTWMEYLAASGMS